jgi:outer membrane protein assembly factor BamB
VRASCFLVLLLCFVHVSTLSARAADDWPQFRGPDGQGHAEAAGLPTKFSETEHVAWKTAVPGQGWSSPVIQGNEIWITTALDEGHDLRAICVDRQTGEIVHDVNVFQVARPPKVHATNGWASPTPIIEKGRVYVHFGTCGTACLETKTAKVLWRNDDLKLDHEVGPGSSPALFGNLLVLNCDGFDVRYVAALDMQAGKLAWKTDRSGVIDKEGTYKKAFSTPLVINVDGGWQAISPGAERVVSYDPLTGRELWFVRYDGFSNVPRPVYAHGLVYVCTGYSPPKLLAIRPDGQGDVTANHVAWEYTRQVPAKPSPLVVGDELYMVTESGVATCLDARTGEEVWSERLDGKISASPIFADGKMYFASEEGQVTVIRPGTQFEPLAVNQLDGRFMASPAVAGKALFLRTDTHLYRVEE